MFINGKKYINTISMKFIVEVSSRSHHSVFNLQKLQNLLKIELSLKRLKIWYIYSCRKVKWFFFHSIHSKNLIERLPIIFYVNFSVGKLHIFLKIKIFLEQTKMRYIYWQKRYNDSIHRVLSQNVKILFKIEIFLKRLKIKSIH